MPKPSPVFRYRNRSWRVYNRALINRGRLTVWFDQQAVTAWRDTNPAVGPGALRVDTDLVIDCALVFKTVYHLSLRTAQRYHLSVMELMKLTLPVPDYCTVSRRQGTRQVRFAVESGGRPRPVVIDASGLKVYGAEEWHVRKQRVSCRRSWRKLHMEVDEQTKEIVAVDLTEGRVHDSQHVSALLKQIPDPIEQVSGGERGVSPSAPRTARHLGERQCLAADHGAGCHGASQHVRAGELPERQQTGRDRHKETQAGGPKGHRAHQLRIEKPPSRQPAVRGRRVVRHSLISFPPSGTSWIRALP